MIAVDVAMGERAGGEDDGMSWGGLTVNAKVGSGRTRGVMLDPLVRVREHQLAQPWTKKINPRLPFHQLVLDFKLIPSNIIPNRSHIRHSTRLTIQFRLTDTYHMIQFTEA